MLFFLNRGVTCAVLYMGVVVHLTEFSQLMIWLASGVASGLESGLARVLVSGVTSGLTSGSSHEWARELVCELTGTYPI